MEVKFVWHRCLDGYQISKNRSDPGQIVLNPVTDRMENFDPLKTHSALLRQLAGIETGRGFIQFANCNGLLSHRTTPEPIEMWRSTAQNMRTVINQCETGNYDCLSDAFSNEHLGNAEIDIDCTRIPPVIITKIKTLRQVMWWQFINSVTNRQNFEMCAWCSTWFTVGQGTGRRRRRSNTNRSFCSPQHQGRFAYNSIKQPYTLFSVLYLENS